jgi:hypothetical protein
MTTTYSQCCEKNDGWLLAIMSFGCTEFGWPLEYVLDQVSVLSLLLLLRQKSTNAGKTMMTLADKEQIDSNDWSKLVEENHKKLA